MRIDIENIAKVNHASVAIDGITVIAGENDTGKSTIGKVLFCFFNGLHDIDRRLEEERERALANAVSRLLREAQENWGDERGRFGLARFLTDEITTDLNELLATQETVSEDDIIGLLASFEIFEIDDDVESGETGNKIGFMPFDGFDYEESRPVLGRIKDALSISREELFRTVLTRSLNDEFNHQINDVDKDVPARATLFIKKQQSSMVVQNDEVVEFEGIFPLELEAIYFDDLFVVDDITGPIFGSYGERPRGIVRGDHRTHLEARLCQTENEPTIFDEILDARRLKEIEDKINDVCPGVLSRQGRRSVLAYRRPGKNPLDARNISSGLKTFAIMKDLIMNGSIETNGTIILDEPEVHLHPEWQLVFAELIVMLQKEYGLHILLNTHSPYFLNAIQVYAAKHSVADRCRYYLAENEASGSVVREVTECIDLIYQRLARPLQELEDEAYGDGC